MNQEQFMKVITDLQDTAFNQGGRICVGQITDKLGENFTKEQLDAVYSYLQTQRCTIVETEAELTESTSNSTTVKKKEPKAARKKMASAREASRLNVTETTIYRSYMEELEAIIPCTLQETEQLLIDWKKGDIAARNRLTEGHLHRVAQWAADYAGKGLAITDLIQEGNMALMLYLEEEILAEEFLHGLYQNVTQAIEAAIEDIGGNVQIKETLAVRANRLMQISAELAEEYEREPTLAELADRLHLSEDEVKEVMKMSMNAMNIEER